MTHITITLLVITVLQSLVLICLFRKLLDYELDIKSLKDSSEFKDKINADLNGRIFALHGNSDSRIWQMYQENQQLNRSFVYGFDDETKTKMQKS